MTKRQVFYSFHFKNDSWRAGQVRNIGVVEGNMPVSSNDWEEVKRKGVVGIYVHNLKNIEGEQDIKGDNPFKLFCIDKTFNYIIEHKHPADSNEINLSEICKTYDPPYKISTNVYDYIKEHINEWVEEAIRIRNQYPK